MSAILLDGKQTASQLEHQVAERVKSLTAIGITPCLAVILVGEDKASQVYVRNKEKACERTGILSRSFRLDAGVTQQELLGLVDELNQNPVVHGILVQLPLPAHLDSTEILNRIRFSKDVDGFHPMNAGLMTKGQKCLKSCTPAGVMYLLRTYGIEVSGMHAVVLGRSQIVGRPMATLLLNASATVTVCHSRTDNLPELTRQADLLVAAVGHAGFVTPDMVRPGAVVIDVGIHRTEQGLRGDVMPEVAEIASYMTPVPGGVGPMTVAMLMNNVAEAASWAVH